MNLNSATSLFTQYEKIVIFLLATLQFTIILDFMVMSPLGAILMPALNINTIQFGLVVSAYAFSAGASGILAAGFADKYDRKKLLLFFYTGFVLGTALCGLAPNYEILLLARIVTGLFGGVIGSITMAIVTDLFSLERRGKVMGFVQMGFSASQILGIPIGIFLANKLGWHSPFLMIVGMSILLGIVLYIYLQPVNKHLGLQKKDDNPFQHLLNTATNSKYLQAFFTTSLLSIGGFMIMPFSSAFLVNNVKIHQEQLPIIYMVTGLASLFILPTIGFLSDKFGSLRVLVFGSTLSAIMVYVYTHLSVTPLWGITLINTIFFVGIMSRAIPAQTLMSAIPEAKDRGAFMGLMSSLQQLAGGIGSVLAGLVIVQEQGQAIAHFDRLGYIVMTTIFICVVMMFRIQAMVNKK